jgi:GNAT superfamily N-acetyltransferase
MAIRIRNYAPGDVQAVVDLWNLCLPLDAVTREIFEDRILLDPNFDPDGCLVAEDDGGLFGFVHAVVRTTPFPRGFAGLLERDRDTGWIVALFVHPERRRQGLGTRLLGAGLEFIRSAGRSRAVLFNYTPNYLLVGLDERGYPGARQFYEANGFRAGGEIVGMACDLLGFEWPQRVREAEARLRSEGIEAVYFDRSLLLPTLEFLGDQFPAWVHYFLDKPARGHEPDEIVVVLDSGRVIGYCQHRYYQHVERTGPFGVDPAYRGRGVGSVMLCRLLERMAQKGYRQAWFTGTDTGTAHYYAGCGYREVRRHIGMSRAL